MSLIGTHSNLFNITTVFLTSSAIYLKERFFIFALNISDLQLDFLEKQGHEYTKEHREFALTLHLHSPKAYKYLWDTGKLPLPHPHTLQR